MLEKRKSRGGLNLLAAAFSLYCAKEDVLRMLIEMEGSFTPLKRELKYLL